MTGGKAQPLSTDPWTVTIMFELVAYDYSHTNALPEKQFVEEIAKSILEGDEDLPPETKVHIHAVKTKDFTVPHISLSSLREEQKAQVRQLLEKYRAELSEPVR